MSPVSNCLNAVIHLQTVEVEEKWIFSVYPLRQLTVSRLPACPSEKAETSLSLCLCSEQNHFGLTVLSLHCCNATVQS